MTDLLRQNIYNYIDKNGIPGQHLGYISFEMNTDDNVTVPNYSRKVFVPHFRQFDLSERESEQIVIDYVFHTANIRISSAVDLVMMKNIDNRPFFLLLNEHDSQNLKYCLAFGSIPGSVIFRDTDEIISLGNIEEIHGDLGFSNSSVNDLGNLKKVYGNLWIAQTFVEKFTNLSTLHKLEYVSGDVSLKNSPIQSLGNLKFVGGNLNLRQTFIDDLGLVEYIGGNLLLPKDLKGKIDTSKTKIIGKIKYFNDRSLDSIL